MRKLKTHILTMLSLLFLIGISYAQDADAPQAYWVHEDVVKPSKVQDYESICGELIKNMKQYNTETMNVIVTNTDDNRYLWVSPLTNMADLDKPVFAGLAEKMGKEAMDNLFNRMDECYDTEQDYVLYLSKKLSYMPDGISQTTEGEDYRKFHYFHITPSNRKIVSQKMEEISKLFQSKGSKFNYRVYKSGFGVRGEFYMVAVSAKNAVDYAEKVAANNALLGDEWIKLYGELNSNLLKYESVSGRMRPDMAYSSEK